MDSNQSELLVPLHLRDNTTFFSDKPSVIVKTQLEHFNPKINESIKKFVYAFDTVNAQADINDFKRIINLQVVRDESIQTNQEEISKCKSYKNDHAELNIESSKNKIKLNRSYILLSSNNCKNDESVISDPLLSAKPHDLNSKCMSSILNSKSEESADSILEEDLKCVPYYRPYPMFLKKSKMIKWDSYKRARINIGTMHQANVPELLFKQSENTEISDSQNCLWNPKLLPNEYLLENYCTLLKTNVFRSFIKSEEEGLKLLNDVNGKVHIAISNCLKEQNFVTNEDNWTKNEFEYFYFYLQNKGKKFDIISKHIGTKSTFQCIQMYYLLKKNTLNRLKCKKILCSPSK